MPHFNLHDEEQEVLTTKEIIGNIMSQVNIHVPASFNNAVFARRWVLDAVGCRLQQDDPLESGTGKFEYSLVTSQLVSRLGTISHRPILEKIAYDITKRFLPIIPDKDNRKEIGVWLEENNY